MSEMIEAGRVVVGAVVVVVELVVVVVGAVVVVVELVVVVVGAVVVVVVVGAVEVVVGAVVVVVELVVVVEDEVVEDEVVGAEVVVPAPGEPPPPGGGATYMTSGAVVVVAAFPALVVGAEVVGVVEVVAEAALVCSPVALPAASLMVNALWADLWPFLSIKSKRTVRAAGALAARTTIFAEK